MTGKITKGIAGFYYVHDGKDLYECKAKGIFRKNHEKPLVGDHVEFDVISYDEKTGNITEIKERKNALIRPEVANIDRIFLTFSAAAPAPNYEMLNRYLIMVHDTGIPVSFVINKIDLAEPDSYQKIPNHFRNTSFDYFYVSAEAGTGIPELKEAMRGQTSALAGPSGVGKSSLMNALTGCLLMETGELSRKIERGRNTTRHSEIFYLGADMYLFDTPGFSSVEPKYIEPENLPLYFEEFIPFLTKCRFSSCKHLKETDCAVKQAVHDKMISKSRYESYVQLYEYFTELRRY